MRGLSDRKRKINRSTRSVDSRIRMWRMRMRGMRRITENLTN